MLQVLIRTADMDRANHVGVISQLRAGKQGDTGWLDELAFVPIDYSPEAPADEWSKDIGCGVQYFSQQGVMRLAANAGLEFDAQRSVPERLEDVQRWMKEGDPRVARVYESIGICLGYSLAHYAEFYDIEGLWGDAKVTLVESSYN